MHYRLPDLEAEDDSPSDLGEIEPWLEGRRGVTRVEGHVSFLSAADLPADQVIMVFEHAPYVPRGP